MNISMNTNINQTQLNQTLLASDYAKDVMNSQPDAWLEDYKKDQYLQPLSQADIEHIVQTTIANINLEYDWMVAMRRLRARLMLRWIWQDANNLIDVITLTKELSFFADSAICAARDFAKQPLLSKYGQPIGHDGQPQELIVIGMGKLGAYELNLSSDIDLIFAFDENGQTDGTKSIEVAQFCIYWGQSIIRLLDLKTADGFVFRVDMRLRPWGDGSALAMSHVALERYLEQHGREWERYAWIKARIICGGKAGDELLKMTRPFVYRQYIDYSAFVALREMKGMIEREVVRRNLQNDVKLGYGGIREIEFIVQAFQLIHGGTIRDLRAISCLSVLQKLGELGLLPLEHARKLREAYLFLRRVEHGIQAQQDKHTQQLPADENLQNRLAQTLHFQSWQAFLDQLESYRRYVSEQFSAVIVDRRGTKDAALNNESIATDTESLMAQLIPKLDEDTQNRISQFWASKAMLRMPEEAISRLNAFWPELLKVLTKQKDPQTAMLRLLPLLENVMRRSVYLVMLLENHRALERLVEMMVVSPWISHELTRYPVLLDEFLSNSNAALPLKTDLKNTLRQQLLRVELDDTEGQLRILRLFKKSEVLAVAVSDVLAEKPLMKISDALTDIAEVVLETTLQLALASLVERHGYPLRFVNAADEALENAVHCVRADSTNCGFAIVGYGKLGGIELSYGSDLDLVFLHNVSEQEMTDGAKPISGMEFCAKLAQKMMAMLTTQTLDGRVYEIDTRLRPSGHSGMLVASISAFSQYQQKQAWIWEHQALVRARGIVGDADVLAEFIKIRLETLTQVRDKTTLQTEVRDMRHKMRDHLGTPAKQQAEIFHLKHDRGGIVDIEFIVQYCILLWAHQYPQICQYSDNIRLLASMADAGCLDKDDAKTLTEAYLFERAETHKRALAEESLRLNIADMEQNWQQIRALVHGLWCGYVDEGDGAIV